MEVENPYSSDDDLQLMLLPTEILYHLLKLLPPKNLVRCRLVCTRWRDVIDSLYRDAGLWERFCRQDYENIYTDAKLNSPDCLSWFEVYRSLSLWPKLRSARESIDEFCHSESVYEELISATPQPGGNIMVHKRTKIAYHDAENLFVAKRKGFHGQYSRFKEFEDVAVMLGFNSKLHIVNKPKHDWKSDLNLNTYDDDEIVFNQVQSFIIADRTVFFWKYENEVFYFHLDKDKEPTNIIRLPCPDTVVAMGYFRKSLYILTAGNFCMYECKNSKLSIKFYLGSGCRSNLMDCLYKHNMLENMDWRYYYVMLSNLGHDRHPGELNFICKINIYGDLFFVGIQTGLLNIYYRPVRNGVLDLCKRSPIKKYNFSGCTAIPVLSRFPVLNVTVTETKDGHKLFICMPRKIIVIVYKHNFEVPVSEAVLPYV